MKVRFTNIKWDTDDEDIPELPIELEQEFTFNEVGDISEFEDFLSNWLSEAYGFCHFGFAFEII